jgi:glycerol-3-phosphate dehydrogenase subunit B
MKFDNIIIGGGLSGLTCGITLAKAGKKVAVITAGQSTLPF